MNEIEFVDFPPVAGTTIYYVSVIEEKEKENGNNS